MTDAERWKAVKELCWEAEKLPPAERERFLAGIPQEMLREEVRRMLRAMEEEASASRKWTPAEPSALPPSIGPYRITGLLGRGGMGTVYAAEIDRAGVVQQLALKVIQPLAIGGEMEERFRREQQMLARLEHPGIVRILDAGVTEDQRPYLVMERVRGEYAGTYADNRKLDLAGRIRLVIAVCDAVQAAHRNLIAHLDLKPSNILVTDEGQVKLLDFGTAKLIDPRGALTTTQQLTPLYASPEQLRGEAVSTACDIYSLGLILFELVTGAWPFASRDSMLSMAQRAAGHATVQSPATVASAGLASTLGTTVERLRGQLRGDLEAIFGKALAFEPKERYESVAAFSADLSRYLAGLPVMAQRQTTVYRLRKYAARNAGAIGLTVLLAVALLGSAGYAFWQQREKVAAGKRAQATAHFLYWMLASSNPLYGGRQGITVQELVDRAQKRLKQKKVLDDAVTANLQSILGNLTYTAGRPADGLAIIREAVTLARTSGDPTARVNTLGLAAQMEVSAGRCPEAIALVKEGNSVAAAGAASILAGDRIAFLVTHGMVKENCEKDLAGSAALIGRAAVEARKLPDDESIATPGPIFKALVLNGHGLTLSRQRSYPQARAAVEEGLRLVANEPDSNGVKVALLRTLATVEYAEKNLAGAVKALEQATQLMEGYTSPFEYLRMKVMLAGRIAETGDKERAAGIVSQVVEETRRRAAEVGQTRWMIFVDAAFTDMRANRCPEALELVREADTLAGKGMPAQWRGNRLAAEGLCLLELDRRNEARLVLREALSHLDAYLMKDSPLRARMEAALK